MLCCAIEWSQHAVPRHLRLRPARVVSRVHRAHRYENACEFRLRQGRLKKMRGAHGFLVLMACLAVAAVAGQSSSSPEIITKVKRSPPKSSGPGRQYSEWYVLESDPAPTGFQLADAQFKLEGSGGCGETAQCLEGERTPQQSTWLFRIQGPGQDQSPTTRVAVLTTTYRKVGTETSYTVRLTTKEKFSSRGGFFGCFESLQEATESDGPWCFLSAERPKPGYRIKEASFSLQGDRECVGNDSDPSPDDPSAWCRLVTRTGDQAVWQFKMLGHTEGPSNTAAASYGKLTVVYEKKP